MAYSRLTELTNLAVPSYDDLLYIVNDPGGVAGSYKAALSTLPDMFYPELHGAMGDGVTDDSVAIQAAIDAAGANEGGIVKLTRTYLVSQQGIRDFAFYADVDYALQVPYSNVGVVGPGTLMMTTAPVTTMNRFVVLAFGTGGTDDGSVPYEDGDWSVSNHCIGVTFDMSGLSLVERQAINSNPSGIIEMAYCKHFLVADNTILEGFGFGPINTLPSSKLGNIVNNRVLGACRCGMWLDGLRGSTVRGNVIAGDIWGITDSIASNGIAILANSDNKTNSGHNVISGNVLINCKGGAIAGTGIFQQIIGNTIYHTTGGGTAIRLTQSSNANGEYSSSGSTIIDNVIHHTLNLPTAKAIVLEGKTVGGYDGSPVELEDWAIQGNVINDNWGISVELGEQAKNGLILNNHLPGDINEDVTATGNIIRENTGYVTENHGAAAAVADGGTIAHGCADTPTVVEVTASLANEFASVTAIGAANITVAIKKHDGTPGTNQTIFWRAYV